jgi:hypothetical protein
MADMSPIAPFSYVGQGRKAAEERQSSEVRAKGQAESVSEKNGTAENRSYMVIRGQIGLFFLCVFAPLREVFDSPWANSSSR